MNIVIYSSSGSLVLKSPFCLAHVLYQTGFENEHKILVENNLKEITEFKIIFFLAFDKLFANSSLLNLFNKKSLLISNELEEIIGKSKNINKFDSENYPKTITLEYIKNFMIHDFVQVKRILILILLNNPMLEFRLAEYHVELLNESLETFELQFFTKISTLDFNFQKVNIFSLINLFSIYKKINSVTYSSKKKIELIAMMKRFFEKYSIKMNTICVNFDHLEYLNTLLQMALLKSEYNSPILETFIKMNYEINRKYIILNNLNDNNLIIMSIIKNSLKNNLIEKITWKKLFIHTLMEKQSFIKSLIDECVIIISKNKLNILSRFFSINEFCFFKTIVLMIGISKAKDISTAQKLISILDLNSNNGRSIKRILYLLKNHLDFISWFFLHLNKYFLKILFYLIDKFL